MPYRQIRKNGITFLLKYGDEHPELLHIFVRHLTTEQDVVNVFFDPNRKDVWNAANDRYESKSATHTLYWFWRQQGSVVTVITCFTNEENEYGR